MSNVLIISDDLTGACNSASYFIKNTGINVLIDPTNMSKKVINSLKENEVLVLNTNTRTEEKKQAYVKIKKLSKLIPGLGKRIIIKKIDTAYRGNVAIELDTIIKALNWELCFIINSVPSMDRITIGGFQIINGKILENTEFTNDPYEKNKSSFIPDILGENLKEKLGLVSLRDVKKGLEDIQNKIENSVNENIKVLIFDSVSNSDIENIITAAHKLYRDHTREKILWVGSLGLIQSLSNYLFKNYNTGDDRLNIYKNKPEYKLKPKTKTKKILGVSASALGKTKIQIRNAEDMGLIKIIKIDINKYIKSNFADDSNVINVFGKDLDNCLVDINFCNSKEFEDNLNINIKMIKSEFEKNNIFIIPEVGEKIKTKRIEKIILKVLVTILEKLFCKVKTIISVDRLILVGGETSFYILKALNTKTIQIIGKIEDGIDYGVISDGILAGKEISIKGGSVGNEDAVVRMMFN